MWTADIPPVITDDVITRLQSSAARFSESANLSTTIFDSTIMIVDDEPINIRLVRKYLSLQGYHNFVTITESPKVFELVRERKPDLVLLDVMMPVQSGLDVLRQLRGFPDCRHLPVIVLTALSDRDVKLQALELGAADFLSKPLDVSELLPRVRNVLMAREYQNRLASYSAELETAVAERTVQLEQSRLEVVHCLARAAEFHDDVTGHHVVRVGKYAGIIARKLGKPARWCSLLELAAQLHDVGKLGIPDAVLQKPHALDASEVEIMRQHCVMGRNVLSQIDDEEGSISSEPAAMGGRSVSAGRSPLIEMARTVAMTHHEKWDGSGYPLGLAGQEIPLEGRITAIADVFDALTNRRAYKPEFTLEKSLEILRQGSASHFDPEALEAFFDDLGAIIQVRQGLGASD